MAKETKLSPRDIQDVLTTLIERSVNKYNSREFTDWEDHLFRNTFAEEFTCESNLEDVIKKFEFYDGRRILHNPWVHSEDGHRL